MFILSFIVLLTTLVFSSTNLPGCLSNQGRKIDHFDFEARETGLKKRILILGTIHGDETQSHELAQIWLERLRKIKGPSNTWRIIPIVNPDGFNTRTRYNANKVDLNRNFPTKDWDQEALKYWQERQKGNPRKYPGSSPGSEVETQCVMKHIEDFKPDLVVSIHTPYGQFDFDGPSTKKIATHLLVWERIGTFPGSLGRYLWDERETPVLTIELKPDSLKKNPHGFTRLQDSLSDLL